MVNMSRKQIGCSFCMKRVVPVSVQVCVPVVVYDCNAVLAKY